jgi:hypothetical protein
VGDVLLVLADGLTEVFDEKSNEIGVSANKERFQAQIDSSREDLFCELRTAAAEFDPQMDDRTRLLERYRGLGTVGG